MSKSYLNKSGVVLYVVLCTLFIVIILTNVVLSIIRSQSRLTHHQVSRIQAYYAALAGINYALEMLRVGNTGWIPSPDTPPQTRTRTIGPPCPVCVPPPPCPPCTPPDVMETEFPSMLSGVRVIVEAAGSGINGTRRISATTTYTYTP